MSLVSKKHNVRVWETENTQNSKEHQFHNRQVTIWCAMARNRAIGPYYFDTRKVNGSSYLDLLSNCFYQRFQAYLEKFSSWKIGSSILRSLSQAITEREFAECMGLKRWSLQLASKISDVFFYGICKRNSFPNSMQQLEPVKAKKNNSYDDYRWKNIWKCK